MVFKYTKEIILFYFIFFVWIDNLHTNSTRYRWKMLGFILIGYSLVKINVIRAL